MELRHLRYFVAVAEELNFTRAAQRLHTAQPSLSQQIRNLEDEIGTPLLERTSRKVELTEAGKVFLAEARLIIVQSDRAISRARQAARDAATTITIGFVPAAEIGVFPEILPRWRLMFPETSVKLRSLPTEELEQALLHGDVDVAFMRNPVRSPALVKEVVLVEPLIALLPVNHPLARLDQIAPHELSGVPFISTHPNYSGQVYTAVEEYFTQHKIEQNVVQVATNILLNLNLVGMGLGYALLPEYAASLTNSSICARPLAGEAPHVDLLMVSRDEPHPAELAGLLAIVREHFADCRRIEGSD